MQSALLKVMIESFGVGCVACLVFVVCLTSFADLAPAGHLHSPATRDQCLSWDFLSDRKQTNVYTTTQEHP